MTRLDALKELQQSVAFDAVRSAIDEIEERMERRPLAFTHEWGDLAREALWNLRELETRLIDRAVSLSSPMAERVAADEREAA